MRPAATLMHLALAVSSVAPVVSAWPNWLPERDSLVVRADDDSSSATATGTDKESDKPSETASPTGSTTKGAKTTGNLNTATPKPTKTGTASDDDDDKKTTAKPTHTEFAADAPLGGASMIEPPATGLGTALYRISEYVTFSWNYTSLLGTPTAIDVLASCTTAAATWTLAANMSFESSVNFVWDTKKQANDANQPLLTAQYMLIIKDSNYDIGENPDPGYLGANQALSFGLYAGKPYQNLSEWKCPGCKSNAAPPSVDQHALKFAAGMSAATVLGFTWFVAGL